MRHLIDRFRQGRISAKDFVELKDWLDTDPDVPLGAWYKKFPKFILVGEGELPKTFLTSGMVPHGKEVK